MEVKIIESLKIDDMYFEVGDIVSFILLEPFSEWYGELLRFNNASFTALVDNEEKTYNFSELEQIWK